MQHIPVAGDKRCSAKCVDKCFRIVPFASKEIQKFRIGYTLIFVAENGYNHILIKVDLDRFPLIEVFAFQLAGGKVFYPVVPAPLI